MVNSFKAITNQAKAFLKWQRKDHTDKSHPDFNPHLVLMERGIKAVFWFDDAFRSADEILSLDYVCLLVADPRSAAEALVAAGYTTAQPPETVGNYLYGPLVLDDPFYGGVQLWNESSSATVRLFAAPLWDYDLNGESRDTFNPLMSKFVNSLMHFWLIYYPYDLRFPKLPMDQMSSLISECYEGEDENGCALKSLAWVDNLRPAHRELHYDILGGHGNFATERSRDYHVRKAREIEEGLFEPKPYRKGEPPTKLGTLVE